MRKKPNLRTEKKMLYNAPPCAGVGGVDSNGDISTVFENVM